MSPGRHRSPARSARRRRAQGGFTLIELTVALLAGLIVGIAVVGLSRDSTRTFHEEMRASSAEANLRSAVDRLRADLSRAGFMSTANIARDLMITKAPGVLNPAPPGLAGLAALASIRYFPKMSVPNGLTLSAKNGVDPAYLQIGGNMTSSEQFAGSISPNAAGGCQQIFLNPQTPAMFRLLNSANPAAELRNIFQPVPAGVNAQFMVRVADKVGHSQFLVTCPGAATGINGAAPGWQPWVAVSPNTPVLTASQTAGTSIVTGYSTGDIFVNPVQLVRWEILPASREPLQYIASPLGGQPLSPTTVDPNKYDLVRSFVDAVTNQRIPQTTEVIAEYAVDLDVAFSIETGNNLAPKIVTYPFGDATNTLYGQDVTNLTNAATTGPQRIRSVRARVVTRTAQADRTLNVPPPVLGAADPFMYRYCLNAAGCDPVNTAGILQYARARTLTIEVALPNQSTSFYL